MKDFIDLKFENSTKRYGTNILMNEALQRNEENLQLSEEKFYNFIKD
jgi:hypothetical protein